MKKYLIPSTLLAVAAMAAPAFADEITITFVEQNSPAQSAVSWTVDGTHGYYVGTNLSTEEYFTFKWGALTAVDSSGGTITSPQIMNQNNHPLDDNVIIPYDTKSWTLSFTITATEDIEISYLAFQFVAAGNGGGIDNNYGTVASYTATITAGGDTVYTNSSTSIGGVYESDIAGSTSSEHYLADYIVMEFDEAISLSTGESITFTLEMDMNENSPDVRAGLQSIVVGTTPEPSMFGLMFGLGAIGLVATRRRRR